MTLVLLWILFFFLVAHALNRHSMHAAQNYHFPFFSCETQDRFTFATLGRFHHNAIILAGPEVCMPAWTGFWIFRIRSPSASCRIRIQG